MNNFTPRKEQKQDRGETCLDVYDDDFSSSVFKQDGDTVQEEEEEDALVHGDSRRVGLLVSRSKMVMYVVLILAAGVMTTFTYIFTQRSAYREFQTEFSAQAVELIDESDNIAYTIYGQLQSFSSSMTSHALAAGQKWPYVTDVNFDVRTQEASSLSQACMFFFAPLVQQENRSEWEQFAQNNQDWFDYDFSGRAAHRPDVHGDRRGGVHRELLYQDPMIENKITSSIYPFEAPDGDQGQVLEPSSILGDVALPVWQYGPHATSKKLAMLDLATHPSFQASVERTMANCKTQVSEILDLGFLIENVDLPSAGNNSDANGRRLQDNEDSKPKPFPVSYYLQPVFEGFESDSKIVGFVGAIVSWETFFKDVLFDGKNGIDVLVFHTCGDTFTVRVNGEGAEYKGVGCFHDPAYRSEMKEGDFVPFAAFKPEDPNLQSCKFSLQVYPSHLYFQSFESNDPFVYSAVVLAVFLCTVLVFIVYDALVSIRQGRILRSAKRSNAIVTSLFPKEAAKRLLRDEEEKEKRGRDGKGALWSANYFGGGLQPADDDDPIADLFPECTVFFCDIVGFTAWSSTREPNQVFRLLETLYSAFDELARQRHVFKVETVGDCYVAVTGLPEARKDHALVMARYSVACRNAMRTLLPQLEVELGPDTAALGMRFGLNSGPVTAGVLRGDRGRFQLFGDAVNTAARMESTGKADRIQVSEATFALLKNAGKEHWLIRREEAVQAKGLGLVTTYWLEPNAGSTELTSSIHKNDALDPATTENAGDKRSEIDARLVSWNVNTLKEALQRIKSCRDENETVATPLSKIQKLEKKIRSGQSLLKDVGFIRFVDQDHVPKPSYASIELGEAVEAQLSQYVSAIASLYHTNSFHNLEHASHVTSSVKKLLSRIINPKDMDLEATPQELHRRTFGIATNPTVEFGCLLASLVHDLDHAGVSNMQLINENAHLASVYEYKSVAEHNSLDIAWNLLMADTFKDLRRAIYVNEKEFHQFRDLLVSLVLSTDVMDKELNGDRRKRWEATFASMAPGQLTSGDHTDKCRKATIVLEHLIQASDVAHTMQHWHVYQKWNARLFGELYTAFKAGRLDKDPSIGWFQGEIGFFDFYVIPLAKKLKDCGVFGVSSDEYLQYAEKNRKEWEKKGKGIVAELVHTKQVQHPPQQPVEKVC